MTEEPRHYKEYQRRYSRLRRRQDGYSRLHKGRCFIEPLLGPPRGRKPSHEHRRRSKRLSQHAKPFDPSLAFGEIPFLKNKLGFTLPTVEDTVKSASLVMRPKGRLLKLDDTSKRFTTCLQEAGLLYTEAASLHPRRRRSLVQPYLRSYSAPTELAYTRPSERTKYHLSFSRSMEQMDRNRIKEKSNLDLLLRNLEPAFHKVKQQKERAILPQDDGSVVVYTKEELDKFYDIDEETLKFVKHRIAADRRKLEEERQQNSLSRTSTEAVCIAETIKVQHRRKCSLRYVDMFHI